MQDHDTQRVHRLYDFTKAQLMPSDQACCIPRMVDCSDADRFRSRGIEIGSDQG
jgi:hypothetical protein